MGNWNLGSVQTETLLLVDGVPDNISGALLRIADRQRQKVEEYTGITIGSNAIEIKHQEAILQLTIAKTANDMLTFGAKAQKIKLGDFEVNKGSAGVLDTVAKNSAAAAKEELRCLGRRIDFFKVNG